MYDVEILSIKGYRLLVLMIIMIFGAALLTYSLKEYNKTHIKIVQKSILVK